MDLYQQIMDRSPMWSAYEIIIAISILLIILVLLRYFRKKRGLALSQGIAVFLISVYNIAFLHSTVFGRTPGNTEYNLNLFWSYGQILSGDIYIFKEVILNIMALIPVGILIPFISNKKVKWYYALIIGIIISGSVEVLQLVLERGLFEFDDIFHNCLGCIVGCLIGNLIYRMIMEHKNGV